MRAVFRGLRTDRRGSAALEFGLIAGLVLSVSLAAVEFGYVLFQWNSAAKAAQLGARLASVSDPIASDLKTLTGLESGAEPGDPMPHFERVCDGKTQTCDGDSANYNTAAMDTLIYGRGSTTCQGEPASFPGMCDIFSRIRAENVIVTYVHSGLGFAGRPGGPVPTITVELQNVSFDFIVLDKLLGLASMSLPTFRTTVTGEDLSITH